MSVFLIGLITGIYLVGVLWSMFSLNGSNFSVLSIIIMPWIWPLFAIVFLVVAPIALFLDWRDRKQECTK